MSCSTNIVDCLKSKGYKPEASASSTLSAEYIPSNALDYVKDNSFTSQSRGIIQWWMVDFKRKISMTSYQLKALGPSSPYSWVNYWSLIVSSDNKTWIVVDKQSGSAAGTRITIFKRPMNARFARIEGTSIFSEDQTRIRFNYVKFFGSLDPVKDTKCTIYRSYRGMDLKIIHTMCLICL